MTLEVAPASDVLPTVREAQEVLKPLPLRTLLVMSASCAAAAANIYYNQPLLAEFSRFFHTSIDRAGLVAVAAQVGYGTGLLIFVPLGDLIERRKIVLFLAYTCMALLAVAALSTSLWMLVAAQLLVGMTAVSTQLLIPLAIDLAPAADRGRIVGSLMAGVLCGLLLARTLAGFIGDQFGWRTMFWIATGVMFATAIVLQIMLPHRPPTSKLSYVRLMRSLWGLLRDQPVVRTASLVSALSFAAFCAFWAVLSFLMRDQFNRGATDAGLFGLVGLVGAVCAPLAGKLTDRRGAAFTQTIALAVTIFAFAQMWMWSSIAGLIVGVLALDLGVQSTTIAAQSEVMAILPAARNRLNTIYMVTRYVGGAVGSTIGTLAYARLGWPGACAICIAFLICGTIVHLVSESRRRALPR